MIVADASFLCAAVLTSRRPPDLDLHAPEVCDLEFASAIRCLLRTKRLAIDGAAQAVADYLSLPLTRHRHAPLLARVLDLRDNFSAYDASYVALAEELEARILTLDAGLARAVRRHAPHVELA